MHDSAKREKEEINMRVSKQNFANSMETMDTLGYRFNYYTNHEMIHFRLLWLQITFVITSALYFAINKETYRKR